MAAELTPEGLRQARFRTTVRGYDRAEVETTLDAIANELERLENERAKLEARLAEMPGHDLSGEFESVGREVATILEAAREAAVAMRDRASMDASRWRTEATEEAGAALSRAQADAEAMRRDAWVTGSELLEQAERVAEAMRANAERDVLTVMGEAEREAHRLTSGARREADDLVRNASMDAEKMTADATKRRDEIIDAANRQAATAQERTRALEQRRDELLEELENVRSTLTRLEGSLEERREALDISSADQSSVKVVHPPADAKKQWELGETVRVVPPDAQKPPEPEVTLADEMSEQVAQMRQTEEPLEPEPIATDPEAAATGPEPQATEPEPDPEPEPEPEPEPTAAETTETEPRGDEVDALFASLRGSNDVQDQPEQKPAAAKSQPAETEPSVDWIAVREERLLPITNRALRGVKKAMTEVQNVVLDGLRTEESLLPEQSTIAAAVHAELVAVWAESFAAGHAVAEQMTDTKLKRPPTPPSHADEDFASDLGVAVSTALDKAGDSPRERQSAASRVFRVWRSDEAERRVRDIALRGYEAGLDASRKVQAGS